MDSKCHHMYPYEKEAEEHLIHREKVCEDRTEKDLKMSALKIGAMQLQTKETDLHQRLEGARNALSPRVCGRSRALPIP